MKVLLVVNVILYLVPNKILTCQPGQDSNIVRQYLEMYNAASKYQIIRFNDDPNLNLIYDVNDRKVCNMPIVEGNNCSTVVVRWGYNQSLDQCVSFWYTGCNGNDNNFFTPFACDKTCVKHGNMSLNARKSSDYRDDSEFDTRIYQPYC